MEKKFKVWDKEYKKFIIHTMHISFDLNGYVYNLQNGEGGPEKYDLIQYIGLKDIHNIEIYENDIVKGVLRIEEDDYDFEGVVTFDSGAFICEQADFSLDTYELEIIGNIYESK